MTFDLKKRIKGKNNINGNTVQWKQSILEEVEFIDVETANQIADKEAPNFDFISVGVMSVLTDG